MPLTEDGCKYIFVTGGVMSGLGKGVLSASIGKLLQMAGFHVTCIKMDPYLNMDAGTMNPIIHGEVFVTEDGGETDMDIGTYERFLNMNLTKEHNITAGQIYSSILSKEREGDYLGRCVQIIPHVTDEIKSRIRRATSKSDCEVAIVECGGTVGDIEGLPFLEALRQIRLEEGAAKVLFVHLTLAPVLEPVKEVKTKPTQHSVQELRRIGIQPDILVVRSKIPLDDASKQKLSLFTSVDVDSVISDPDSDSVYHVPSLLADESILATICRKLLLKEGEVKWDEWRQIEASLTEPKDEILVGIVGKYMTQGDSYASVVHALKHAAASIHATAKIQWIDSERLERGNTDEIKELHGILVPGGFGTRGSLGKMLAIDYARKMQTPFLGLCFGFQLALAAFSRFVCGLSDANSTELDPNTSHPVVDLLPDQRGVKDYGATMRLGSHVVRLIEGSIAHRIYESTEVKGRHRHRFELNPDYRKVLEDHGMRITGYSDEGRRAEVLELPTHPFFVATQYHPEFRSRPGFPEPVFRAFVKAAQERKLTILA
jgi:CTP synthase